MNLRKSLDDPDEHGLETDSNQSSMEDGDECKSAQRKMEKDPKARNATFMRV